MNILVTGGAGFIGSHLAERLLDQGHRVWILDDFSTGRREYLAQSVHPGLTIVQGSVTDRRLLKELVEQVEVIFHLAAVLGVKNTVDDPLKVIEGNIDGTRNVLESAFSRRIKVVFTSTSEVYGKNNNLPFRETGDRVYGASSVHRWCYATAKSLDEHMCFAYADKGLPVAVIRYFNAYGPRQTNSQYGGVVARFIRAALRGEPLEVYGGGLQSRCFTFVDDTVAGTVAALSPRADGLAFNIGSDTLISIRELAERIIRISGSTSAIVYKTYEEAYGPGYEDMPARTPDLSRSRAILGYAPSVPLDEGLKRTIDWYRGRV